MAATAQAALKAAKQKRNLAVNPRYTVNWHGFLNIIEVVAALSELVVIAAKLMVVVSFADGYTSLMMLTGDIVSAYAQAYLPLSLYVSR